jgi:hypothetical protein
LVAKTGLIGVRKRRCRDVHVFVFVYQKRGNKWLGKSGKKNDLKIR